MNKPAGECPDAAVLAAFVEGSLASEEREAAQAHVSSCEACVWVMGETAQFLHIHNPAVASHPMHWSRVAAVIATIALTAFAASILHRRVRTRDLAVLSVSHLRPSEGQLHGFVHAPFTAWRSENRPKPSVEVRARTERLILGSGTDPASLHARGVALLIRGDALAAVRALSSAAERDGDRPMIWNDLAAAWIAQAAISDARSFENALAAADRARSMAPFEASPHFNRAVALEHLGRLTEALHAYRAALETETDPAWQDEIEQRIRRLSSPVPRP
jgi:tetratricopeptide (TPR) repeat protein